MSENSKMLSNEHLKAFLKNWISDHMIPEVFIFMDSLPLSSNGKINRNALPLPETKEFVKEKTYVGPSNEMEQKISQIMQTILKIDKISIHDKFFSLGANSLDMVKLKNMIDKTFDKDVSIINIFEHPTICDLSRFIESHATTVSTPIPLTDRATTRKNAIKRRKKRKKSC